MTNYPKGSLGWCKELAEKVGYPYHIEELKIGPFIKWAQEKGILKSDRKNRDKWAQERGHKDYNDYLDFLAKRLGYKDHVEYAREVHWKKGTSPMEDNEDCSSWLGVYIGEIILSKAFSNIVRMPNNNPKFDWICDKGFKIERKTAVLINGCWSYNVKYNNIADYFLLIAFDNRTNLEPMHIWLIKTEEMVRKGTRAGGYTIDKMWNRKSIQICNNVRSPMSFKYFEKFEWINKLEKIKELCRSKKEELKLG